MLNAILFTMFFAVTFFAGFVAAHVVSYLTVRRAGIRK